MGTSAGQFGQSGMGNFQPRMQPQRMNYGSAFGGGPMGYQRQSPNMGGPMSRPGGDVRYAPDQMQQPMMGGDYRPPGAPQIPMPMQAPQAEQDSGLHPYQPQGAMNAPRDMPMQAPPSDMDMARQNYNSVAGFRMPQQQNSVADPPPRPQSGPQGGYPNPWGFSQQQMGPTFNPFGSSQGGYFQGNNGYVPNVGNPRNGMDIASRFGLNYLGLPR